MTKRLTAVFMIITAVFFAAPDILFAQREAPPAQREASPIRPSEKKAKEKMGEASGLPTLSTRMVGALATIVPSPEITKRLPSFDFLPKRVREAE